MQLELVTVEAQLPLIVIEHKNNTHWNIKTTMH